MYTCMTKVISISDDAYNALKKLKAEKSFSKIIIEITKEKRKNILMESAGSWSPEFADKVKKRVYEERKLPSRRFS